MCSTWNRNVGCSLRPLNECALLLQLYTAFLEILKMRRQRNQFKSAFMASVGAVGLLLFCTLGASIAAAVITKETYSTGNMLATAKGEVIRVAPASYALELIAAPVMMP